ncbi:tRNA dihydrouridine synthase DusB [Labrys monachus]|uniref:tRNA-dihydrouridine synthase n=1 Tax=Labrys monachus TaxID=217067 RepID=A0ABU0FEJ7_9HYPH|nr:tRNA dihydrouridine synthase DusB [Labrys monachus]MDQ0393039.1 nifR3 family TIM-barrel protein [Labrys monachus]
MLGNDAAALAREPEDTVLRIGPLQLANRVILAPMSGVTDAVLRRIARRCGAGLVISEMVASDRLAAGDEEARLRAEGPGGGLHVVQLAGCDARWMGEAARVAVGSGADVIDINMGCPAKRVTGGWSGSALMRDLDHALTLVDATVSAVSVPVTVKMRLGWDETSLNAPELARRAEHAGAAMITVHGRTRMQFYKGRADWGAIRAVKQAVTIPVVANGDCRDLSDALAMLQHSGADAVMVGRAAQGQPWLPGHLARELAAGHALPAPSAQAQKELALEHYEGLLGLYGSRQGVRHARKHLASAMDTARARFGGGREALRHAALTGEDPGAVAENFIAFFASLERMAA